MNTPELIAPAGSLQKLEYAFTFGADTAYCGNSDFSLRTRMKFTLRDIEQGAKHAHARNKKLYVTVNIYAHNRHINKLPDYIKKLKEYNVDALIISDVGILRIVREIWPEAIIHLSTQANVTNWSAAEFWYNQGLKRIVLGREVTLEEIGEIHNRVPELELEYFVHGAMCMAYSGRCILSKYFNNRSANLGDCTQPCRWNYRVYIEEEERPGKMLPIEEDESGTYILNSKDLCLVEHLDKLYHAGITSFKIEGRAKSIYYVSAVSKIYGEAVKCLRNGMYSRNCASEWIKELKKVSNREFTTGFLFGREECEQKYDKTNSFSNYQFVGEVIETRKNVSLYQIHIKPHNTLTTGDQVEFVIPGDKNFGFTIKEMFDAKRNEKIERVHGGCGQIVFVEINKEIPKGSLLRIETRKEENSKP